MSSQQSLDSGPLVNVETWIERGNPGHWLTGRGAKGDVAHFEVTTDRYNEEQWIQDYAAGRKEFSETKIEEAREFFASGQPAAAIITSRMALDIPWRGERFEFDGGVVAKAMGYGDIFKDPDPKDGWFSPFRKSGRAMDEAFNVPVLVDRELRGLQSESREAIKGQETKVWTEAIKFFGEKGELHAAGIGALELAAAHEEQGQTDSALAVYKTASELLDSRLKTVLSDKDNTTKNTAEIDELTSHLVDAYAAIVRLYGAKGAIKGSDKEVVKSAVYELDDLGAFRTSVLEGYKLLASHSRLMEKWFYKKEASGIAGELAVARFFSKNPHGALKGYTDPRPNRRHRRPAVKAV